MDTNYTITYADIDQLTGRIKTPPQTLKGNLSDGDFREDGVVTVIRNGAVQLVATEAAYLKWKERSMTPESPRTISEVYGLPAGSFVKHLEESKASGMSPEERSMMPPPASYGEPWSPGRGFNEIANILTSSNDGGWASLAHKDRAIECVNACQGIADPVEALKAAREALKWAAPFAKQCGQFHIYDFCKNALAKLNNTAP